MNRYEQEVDIMAGKKRTTAMEVAWVKAQKEKQRKASVRDKAKNRKDSEALRKKYKNKKQNMILHSNCY